MVREIQPHDHSHSGFLYPVPVSGFECLLIDTMARRIADGLAGMVAAADIPLCCRAVLRYQSPQPWQVQPEEYRLAQALCHWFCVGGLGDGISCAILQCGAPSAIAPYTDR